MNNIKPNIIFVLFLTMLFSGCNFDKSQASSESLTLREYQIDSLLNDWCVVKNKYNDGHCDHCNNWDPDCPSPDAWGRENPENSNDWCVVKNKYNDGHCDHCNSWDPDCPSPDAWGRENPEIIENIDAGAIVDSGVPNDFPQIIHDIDNDIRGLIYPIYYEEIAIPQHTNNAAHFITFIGDSNTDNPYLDPSYNYTTIPPITEDLRYSSIFARLNNLTYASRHELHNSNYLAQVVNMGSGGANTRFFINRYPQHQSQYVVVSLGLNERRHYPVGSPLTPILEQFKIDTLELIDLIESKGSVPILMTNVYQDAINGHQASLQGDNVITLFDNVYRLISTEHQVPLIDINLRFRQLANQGIWDIRRRFLNGTPVLDNRYDNFQTNNHRWFGDVHWNPFGAKIVAEEITRRFSEN